MTSNCLLANAGTPLMWASAFHLFIGNALIGIFEGMLLARIFGFKRLHAILLMIPANYLSCFAGYSMSDVIPWLTQQLFSSGPPLYEMPKMLGVLTVAAYFCTVVIEWPFCIFLTRRTPRPLVTAWKASFLAQSISYAALVLGYCSCSNLSMLTVPDTQHDLAFVKDPWAVVYFINPDDGAVWRTRLNGSHREKILESHLTDRNARLFVKQQQPNAPFDLWAIEDSKRTSCLLLKAVSIHAAPRAWEEPDNEPDTWMNFGGWNSRSDRYDLRDKSMRAWTCQAGFWAAEGLSIEHDEKRMYRLALEIPFTGPFSWACRNTVILPEDQAVFQVADQILVLDLPSRKLGFLTMGRGPVVVLPGASQSPPASSQNTILPVR